VLSLTLYVCEFAVCINYRYSSSCFKSCRRSLKDIASDIEQTPTKKKTKKQSLQPLAAAPPAVSMPARDECRPSISQSLPPRHHSQLTLSSSGSQTTAPLPAMSSAPHDDSIHISVPASSSSLTATTSGLRAATDFLCFAATIHCAVEFFMHSAFSWPLSSQSSSADTCWSVISEN